MFIGPQKESVHSALPLVPGYVRASGGVRVRFGSVEGRTRALERAESGGFRVRFPRIAERCEAVLINTGGGMAGGDRMGVEIAVGPRSFAVVTSATAEKIYRSQGPLTEIEIALRADAESRLDWIPQETIVFSGSRLRRRLTADVAPDATVTIAETVVFGRIAMNEVMARGTFNDRWRVRRGDELVFAEDVRLDGNPTELLAARASGNGARAIATLLHVAPDAEGRLEEARDLLAGTSSEGGASAWNGMLVVRLLARDPRALRDDLIGVLEKFRHGPMPRSW